MMWEIRFMIFIVAFFSLFDFSFLLTFSSISYENHNHRQKKEKNILYRISFHKFLCQIINGHKGKGRIAYYCENVTMTVERNVSHK